MTIIAYKLTVLLLAVSFTKPVPTEVAFSKDGRCFVHELNTDRTPEVDPFICEQLNAEAQRKWDLAHMKYIRPAVTSTPVQAETYTEPAYYGGDY